jgi:hypothetical protein
MSRGSQLKTPASQTVVDSAVILLHFPWKIEEFIFRIPRRRLDALCERQRGAPDGPRHHSVPAQPPAHSLLSLLLPCSKPLATSRFSRLVDLKQPWHVFSECTCASAAFWTRHSSLRYFYRPELVLFDLKRTSSPTRTST